MPTSCSPTIRPRPSLRTFRVSIGSIAAGNHTVGVSLHNASASSSDLGFDLRLLEGLRFKGDVALGDTPLCTGFQDPWLGANVYFGQSNGSELGWSANDGETIAAGAERAFEISNQTGVRLETERIDVSGKYSLTASIDMRAVDTSSGFEDTDSLHVFVEGSSDGLIFRPVADIFARLNGAPAGSPDPFEPYRSDTDYTTFSTEIGDIPDGLVSLRIVAEATANSDSEHIILDNFCVTAGPPPVRILDFSADPATGVSLTVRTRPGNLYEVESSPDLGTAAALDRGGERTRRTRSVDVHAGWTAGGSAVVLSGS